MVFHKKQQSRVCFSDQACTGTRHILRGPPGGGGPACPNHLAESSPAATPCGPVQPLLRHTGPVCPIHLHLPVFLEEHPFPLHLLCSNLALKRTQLPPLLP